MNDQNQQGQQGDQNSGGMQPPPPPMNQQGSGSTPPPPPVYQPPMPPQQPAQPYGGYPPMGQDPYAGAYGTPPPDMGAYDPGMMMPPSAGGGSMGPPMPAGAYPPAGGPPGAYPPGPPKPPSPPANFKLGALLSPVLKVKVPPHELKFDEQYFLHLLAGSISLTKDEKKRIVESIPKLKQSQIDELIRIFEEEREKFAELGQEHVPQLDKLASQHFQDWMDIEMEQQQNVKADEDAKKAEELRKQIGL